MKHKLLTPWRRLIGLLKLEKRDVFQVFYYAIFTGLVALSLPLGIQAIINLLQSAQITTSWIVLVVLVTIGVAFTGVLQLMQMRIIETIQQKIFTRASFEFAYRFPKIKMDELLNYYPPELANRFFDTLSVQKGLSKILIDIPAAVLQIVFALVLLSFYHPFFIVFGIFLLLLIYLLFKFTAQRGMETSLKESKNKYKVAHWIQEIARSIVSFKVSGRTNLALVKNDHLVSDYLKARESHFKVLVIQFIQMISFKVIVTIGLLIIGGILVLRQQMNIGQFVAAEIIILLVINSVEKLILSLEPFYDILTSLEKLGQVVDKKLEANHTEKITFKDAFKIQIDQVSYGVKDVEELILENVSFEINAQDRILIAGESGSGKSSLLQLLSGVIEPTRGNIYVDDHSVKNFNLNHYRAQIGLSLSEESPFEGTIRENITFGDTTIDDETIYDTLKNLKLTEFVKKQPRGLNTILYPEGKQISSTVSKKIVLARAIAKKPRLLVLEKPLDQFEAQEAKSIMEFLTHPDRPWALVVVSFNPHWAQNCKKIITLQNGKIIR